MFTLKPNSKEMFTLKFGNPTENSKVTDLEFKMNQLFAEVWTELKKRSSIDDIV